jgi:hypothetical protein
MTKANMIFLYIIAVAVIGCYLLWYFDPKGRFDPIVTGRDTTVINLPPISIDLPPSQSPTIIYQPIPNNVDSLAVVRDYFAIRQYKDSMENDTVKVIVRESVGQNRIMERKIDWKLKLPITTVIETHTERTRKLLVGGLVSKDSLRTGLYLSAAYQNKKDMIFVAGYDPFLRTGMGGVLMPIKLRREQ